MLLKIDARAGGVLKEFHADCMIRDKILALPEEITKTARKVMDRHTLLKTSNKQHIEIAKLNSWNPSEEQAAVTQRHGTGLLQSQIVEDVIGQQKNDVSTRAHNKYKRPSHPPLPRKLRIQSGVHPAFQLLRCLSFKSINSLGCVQTFMCLFHGCFRW